MNFRDVMVGLGQIPYADMGSECSGVVTAVGPGVATFEVGDRVCGMVNGAYANTIRAPHLMVCKIPDQMSHATAASIPVVFCTAYYALIEVGRLSPDESLLIHAAAGGVGQAAVMIAHNNGAEIFATVGSVEKKAFLMETFGIPEDHIFSSRDITFEHGIRKMTNGRGVDVILNSLAGDALRSSWKSCLAPLGRFLEIGKRDLAMNNHLQMEKFLDSVTFAGIDLGVLAPTKPKVFHSILTKVMEMHQTGTVAPVSPITTYPVSEIQKAMRLMQGGKHMGKVVIAAESSDIVQVRNLEKVTIYPFLQSC